ncbi:MFS transporter [Aromatoleum petrolei]|nr:MFS transporter [Aromatoleum petrolei]QTQ35391.1 Major facilitator superfamily protein [Aromatoleum petrolei]
MKAVVIPLAATLAVQALVSMAALTAPVLAPEAGAELGIPATLVGVFVALIYVGAMLSSLASGNLVVRYGAIRVSQVCLVLCGAGVGLAAIGSPGLMAVSALLIGLGYGPVTPASSHILARTTPAHLMGFMFSLKQTGVPLGGALAGALVPGFAMLWGWQGAALAVAAACVLMAVLAQPTRAGFDADRDPARRLSLAGVFKPLALVFAYPRIRDLAICTFFFGAMQLCLTTYLVTYLTSVYGMPLVTAGLVLALTQGAGVGGRLMWGLVADRWITPRRLLSLLALAMAAASLLTAAFDPDWPFVAVMAVSMLFGATAIGWNGVYLAEVARLAPAGQAGVLTGGTLFFTYFGVVAGPPAFAALVGATGSFAVGYAAIGCVILVIGLLLVLTHARRPAECTEAA